jgi:hypothetical protein
MHADGIGNGFQIQGTQMFDTMRKKRILLTHNFR